MHRLWMWLRSLFARPTELGEAEARDARSMIAAGVGMTALAAVEIAAGSVCPICVVAAPALLGVGAYKRWRARKVSRAIAKISLASLDRE